uniref:Aa_trans domain-containing protein n=1 Tax=Ascaris lumbricoides TaxID=6252 RepID=A0A0M3I005_ASCLU
MKPPAAGTTTNQGKTGKIGELERFENADMESGDSGDSPDVHVPAISAQRLTETILEAAASTDRFRSLNDQVFVTLSVVIGVRDILHFPALCSKHGGVAFLIPYAFAIGTVGAPLVYLESVFGQYTSLPPLQLFDRLGRAFSGIGLATTMMAVMQVMLLGSSIAVSPMFGAKCLGSLHSAVGIWLSNEILHPAPYSNDLVMSGATFVNALVAGIAMLGMRTYVKIAKFLVVFPVAIIVFLTGLILRMIGFQRALLSLAGALAPHFGSLLTLRAWTDAIIHVVSYLVGEWNQLPYTLLPSLFARSGAGLGMLAVLYIAIFVMSLGPQVIALEMIVLTVYRAFPDLLHMDERISRKFICCAYLAATFGYAYVAISTIAGVLIFFDGRTAGISTNWASFLSAAGAALITPTIIVAVLVYRIIEVVRSGQSLRNLFVTDFKWGPKVSTDRQRAIHEEHAARIYT